MKIYVFLYQNLNKNFDGTPIKAIGIYVFLYQNLNGLQVIWENKNNQIYVFLYQNLNIKNKIKLNSKQLNLCISILEFKYILIADFLIQFH